MRSKCSSVPLAGGPKLRRIGARKRTIAWRMASLKHWSRLLVDFSRSNGVQRILLERQRQRWINGNKRVASTTRSNQTPFLLLSSSEVSHETVKSSSARTVMASTALGSSCGSFNFHSVTLVPRGQEFSYDGDVIYAGVGKNGGTSRGMAPSKSILRTCISHKRCVLLAARVMKGY